MKRTLFLHNKPTVGIDIGHSYVKVMAVSRNHRVQCYGSINADPTKLRTSLSGDPGYLASLLKDLFSKNIVGHLTTDQALVCIPTNVTYSRSASLPKNAVKSLDDAVALEAGQYIPVALSELNISYEVLSEADGMIDLLMCAAPKVIVNNVVTACADIGITVVGIQPSINAVAALITATERGSLPTVIVDIGLSDTNLAILHGRIWANASVQIGSDSLTSAIAEKMHVSLENAHQLKVLYGLTHGTRQKKLSDAMLPLLSQIVNEIRRIIRYYNERIDASTHIEQIIIVGIGSDTPGIGEYFTDTLVMPARVASPWLALDFGQLPQPAKQFRPRYTTVIGLAINDAREERMVS